MRRGSKGLIPDEHEDVIVNVSSSPTTRRCEVTVQLLGFPVLTDH